MYFLANKSIYVNTERNDERAIVIFKDFYKDITLYNKEKGIIFRDNRTVRITNDSNGQNNFQNLLNERERLKKESMEAEESKVRKIKEEQLAKIIMQIEKYSIDDIKNIFELNSFLKEKKEFVFSNEESAPLICIEPIGPAYSLNNSKLTGDKRNLLSLPNIASADKGYSVTFSNDQAIAQIYSVSEIMQYAHSSLFNLCLMYGNRVLTQGKYETQHRELKNTIECLIERVTKKTEDKTESKTCSK
jgi:hypothetical protein